MSLSLTLRLGLVTDTLSWLGLCHFVLAWSLSLCLGLLTDTLPVLFSFFFQFFSEKNQSFRQKFNETRQDTAEFGFYASNCVECADRQLWAIFLAHFPDCLGLSLTLCLVFVTDTLSCLGRLDTQSESHSISANGGREGA